MERDKKWLTIREAGSYIGMSVGFLRKHVRLRTVPYTRIGSKALCDSTAMHSTHG